jgi:hypothetical protein
MYDEHENALKGILKPNADPMVVGYINEDEFFFRYRDVTSDPHPFKLVLLSRSSGEERTVSVTAHHSIASRIEERDRWPSINVNRDWV